MALDSIDSCSLRVFLTFTMKTLKIWHLAFIIKTLKYFTNTHSKSNYCIHDIRHSIIIEPRHEISNNVVYTTSKCSDQPALSRSLIRAFASRLNIL